MGSKRKTTSERKLASRRKKWKLGRVIRVSDEVFELLDSQRGKRTWDWVMRRALGLPDKWSDAPTMIEGVLEPRSGTMILRVGETAWEDLEQVALRIAAKASAGPRGWRENPTIKPIRMREIPRG